MPSQEEIYCCYRCNMRTKYPYRLQAHLKVHRLKDTLICTGCRIVFQNIKSMTLWHSRNNLKEHLVAEDMVKKTVNSKELLKKGRKSPQSKHRPVSKNLKDRLNVVLFRKNKQPVQGLGGKPKEIGKSVVGYKETKEVKNDRNVTSNAALGNSLILDLEKLADNRINNGDAAAEKQSGMTSENEESKSNHASDTDHETSKRKFKQTYHLSSKGSRMLQVRLERCNDKGICKQDSEKETGGNVISAGIETGKINSERKTETYIENQTMPKLDKTDENASEKFQCSQCNFKTKYKNFWKLHKHAHLSKDSVTCDTCNIMFSSKRSMIIWHAKNSLKEHVNSSVQHKVNQVWSRVKKRFNPFKKLNKSHVKKKSFQNFKKSFEKGQLGTDRVDSVTDSGVDISIIKEEPNDTDVEMFNNQESSGYSAGKIAGKGFHFAALDKVFFNMRSENLYCDDLVSKLDSLQRKSDSLEVINSQISETLPNNRVTDGNMHSSSDGITNDDYVINGLTDGIIIDDSNDGTTDGNANEGKSGNDNKDLNNNELGGNEWQGNSNSVLRDKNNNMNKDSGGDGDENEDSCNEGMGSPKHVELLICLVCQTSFSSKVLLIKHLVKVHNLTNLCRLCYFRDYQIMKFANPVSLRNHRLKCHEKEMKRCICGTLFIDDKTLQSHQKKFRCAEKEHPKLHKCICGKRFSTEKGLNSHKILKCRKRKSTDTTNKGNISKVGRNGGISIRRRCLSESTGIEKVDLVKEWPVQNLETKKKRKAMRGLRNSGSMSENIDAGNRLNLDQNNNVMHDTVPVKCKENAYCGKKENSRPKSKESKFSMNKKMTSWRKLRENKSNTCKTCSARMKPCDFFYHQKVCHQRQTGRGNMRKSRLRSGKLQEHY